MRADQCDACIKEAQEIKELLQASGIRDSIAIEKVVAKARCVAHRWRKRGVSPGKVS